MKVYYPERFISRHVGGNSTYARRIKEGMEARGFCTGLIPSSFHPAATLVRETLFGLRHRSGSVFHFTGDTGPLLQTGTPSVLTVHGVASRWSTTARTRRQEKIWTARVGLAIKNCDRLITVSTSSAQDVATVFNVDIDKISVIPHGIDIERFARKETLSEQSKEIITRPYILYLGNIEPRKNIIQLLRGYRQSRLAERGLQLVIAGRPAWNYQDTLSEIKVTPGALHLGFVSDSDRVALMQQCELFVFPSIYEGFGFPVLEALAAGAVVLTTRQGSLKEVAGPSLIIPSLDANAISVALEDAISDNSARNRVTASAQGWVRQFNWDISISRHAEVYEAVVKR